jgi:hypothetical protein
MCDVQRLRGCARLGLRRLGEIIFSVNEGMSARPPFYLSQAVQVTTFEIPPSVLELPECAVWVARMENIAL